MPSSFPAGSSKHQGLGLWALGRRQTTKVTAWTILCTPPLGARGWVSAQKFSGQTPPQHHLAPGRRLHLPRTCWEDESHQLAESGVSRAIPPPPPRDFRKVLPGSDPTGRAQGKETRTVFSSTYFVVSKSYFLPLPHTSGQRGGRHRDGLLGPLTSVGCGWGCCPAPEGGG